MYYLQNNVNAVCRTLDARTPSRKSWCDNSCSHKVSATGFTAKICRASLTSFFRNTKRSFLSTAAFGMVIPVASLLQSLWQTMTFGSPKSQETSSVINPITRSYKISAGKLSKFGNANLNPNFARTHFPTSLLN